MSLEVDSDFYTSIPINKPSFHLFALDFNTFAEILNISP